MPPFDVVGELLARRRKELDGLERKERIRGRTKNCFHCGFSSLQPHYKIRRRWGEFLNESCAYPASFIDQAIESRKHLLF